MNLRIVLIASWVLAGCVPPNAGDGRRPPRPACATAGNPCEVGSACTDDRQCSTEMCQEGTCVATTSYFAEVCPPNHRVVEEVDTDPTAACVPVPCTDDACRIVEVVTTLNRRCMRSGGGEVWCWGAGSPGAALPGIDDAIDLDAYRDSICVVRRSGQTVCMRGDAAPEPTEVRGLVQVAMGDHHCGVTAAGAVLCWGGNDHGQLGDGSLQRSFPRPVTVAGLGDAVEVQVGFDHSCARHRTGEVSCWGRGPMLGANRFADSTIPVKVAGVRDAIGLAIGTTSCALRQGGALTCWNHAPQVMDAMPPLARLDGAVFFALDGAHGMMCGALTSGAVTCWHTGVVPAASAAPALTEPFPVHAAFDGPAPGWELRPFDDAVDVFSSELRTCALRRGGEVLCGGTGQTRGLIPVPGTR